jgi:hypothetical protein
MALLVEENSFFSVAYLLRKSRATNGGFEAAFNLNGRIDRTISHSRLD